MPVKIFCCYAHEDERLLDKLKISLTPLEREGLIDVWHDRDFRAGAEWDQEIREKLNSAQIILLLVSPNFIASDYCYGIEMQRALERHNQKEAIVIPIILRRVDWQNVIGKLQALPTNAKPIKSWSKLDDAFYDVYNGIRKVVEQLMLKPSSPSPVPPIQSPQPSQIKSLPTFREPAGPANSTKLIRHKIAEELPLQLPIKPPKLDNDEAPKPQAHALHDLEEDVEEGLILPDPNKSIKALQQPKGKMPYTEFRIIVDDLEHLRLIVNEYDNRKRFSYSEKIPMSPEKARAINTYSRWLAEGKITNLEELILLGTTLYQGLFSDHIDEVFKSEWYKIKEQLSIGLRVILEFDPQAYELAQMPWEYIYYPDSKEERGFFLAAQDRLILARCVTSYYRKDFHPDHYPLRILVVISRPKQEVKDGPDLDIIRAHSIVETLQELKSILPNAFEITVLTRATMNNLSNVWNEFRPHVLHFIGHCRYTDKGEGELALLRDDDEDIASWISDSYLADIFRDYPPRLFFLQAYAGAYSQTNKALSSIALRLVYSQGSAVVTMLYQAENLVTRRFNETFFQSLVQGKRVDEAVHAGRLELSLLLAEERNISSYVLGNPIAYLRSGNSDSIIMPSYFNKPVSMPPSIPDKPKG